MNSVDMICKALVICILLFCFSIILFGQNEYQDPESIITKLEQQKNLKSIKHKESNSRSGKCGFGVMFDISNAWVNCSQIQKTRLQAILTPQIMQKYRIIGHFRIEYDTLGINTPYLLDGNNNPITGTTEQYIDSVGEVFSNVWKYEIDTLQYNQPPLENDSYYRIQVNENHNNYYGATYYDPNSPINSIQPYRYLSYIVVDNDFKDFYTKGISGLKVTAAHEFHHAIQIGSYGLWSVDRYFYEITSTWMEDVVYNEINDYYNYLSNNPNISSQYSHPEIRFTAYDNNIEYSRAVWGKFIEKRYSRNIILRSWKNMRQVNSIQAQDLALREVGSKLYDAFSEFSYWNYFTGTNADTINYYTEGNKYPNIRQRPINSFVSTSLVIHDSLQILSSLYQPIQLEGATMLTIISNINVPLAYSDITSDFTYILSTQIFQGAKYLSNGIYTKIDVTDPNNWVSQETIPTIVKDVLVYPNPYYAATSKSINFRLPDARQTKAFLFIFNSNLSKIYSDEIKITYPKLFEPVIVWNGISNNNNLVSSGIYFYFIEVDGKRYKGKFAVIRE